jgi:hypothetical protein
MKKNKTQLLLKKVTAIVLLVGFVAGFLTITGCQQQEPTWLEEQEGEPAEY